MLGCYERCDHRPQRISDEVKRLRTARLGHTHHLASEFLQGEHAPIIDRIAGSGVVETDYGSLAA
jgi:hypothetical protein